MGNQLCPASTKDFIQGFRELQKGQKQYHPFFRCCMNNQALQTQEQLPQYDFFQEKDWENHHSTQQNSQLNLEIVTKVETKFQVQLTKLIKCEKYQRQQPLIKQTINLRFQDGWRYKGQSIASIPEGQGEEYGPNGEYFVGNFIKGKKHGFGTYKFADGSVYKGQFKDNLMWGFGIFEFPNGDHFEGQFVKNVRQGKGKYFLHQPNIEDLLFFEGEYKNDVKDGAGLMKFVGCEVKGVWRNGNYDYNFQRQISERH